MPLSFKRAMGKLIMAGRYLHDLRLIPATSGNFSCRLYDGTIAITASGVHKGGLMVRHILHMNSDGSILPRRGWVGQSSAETKLHLALYELYPNAQVVLHAHCLDSIVLMQRCTDSDMLSFAGQEILKAFPGIHDHETAVDFPVFENSQDMTILSAAVKKRLISLPDYGIFYIRGHGIYSWGSDIQTAIRLLEAAQFLARYQLQMQGRSV